MTKKGFLHPDQNEFVGKKEEKEKRKKKGGKEVQHLLVSSVRTIRGSTGQEVS